jgi:hypothetical protein
VDGVQRFLIDVLHPLLSESAPLAELIEVNLPFRTGSVLTAAAAPPAA